MSKLAAYRALERQLAEQLEALEHMKKDEGFQKEAEFEDKLRALLGEYGYSLRNVIALLDPKASGASVSSGLTASGKPDGRKGQRAPRALKRYLNPHTNEFVETKGGNHKTLNLWKKEHGAEAVNGWIQ